VSELSIEIIVLKKPILTELLSLFFIIFVSVLCYFFVVVSTRNLIRTQEDKLNAYCLFQDEEKHVLKKSFISTEIEPQIQKKPGQNLNMQ
jgi:hypothetical protein